MASIKLKEISEKMADASQKIESMRSQMDTLKQRKDQFLEARTVLEGADIDEETKELLREAVSSMIIQIESQTEILSDEISEQTGTLEEGMQETQEVEAETIRTQTSLEKTASALDSLGAKGALDVALTKLDSDRQNIEALQKKIIEARKKGEDAQRIASTMGN